MHIIALIVVYADIRLDSYDVDCIIELSGPKNQTTFQVFNSLERCSICQIIWFFIRSKAGALNVALFKYSLHKFSETIIH